MRISVIPLVLAMLGCAGGANHSRQGQDAGQADAIPQVQGGGSGSSGGAGGSRGGSTYSSGGAGSGGGASGGASGGGISGGGSGGSRDVGNGGGVSGSGSGGGAGSVSSAAGNDASVILDTNATSDANVTVDVGPLGNLTVPATHPRLWLNDPAIMARAKTWFATSKFLPDTSHTAADNPAWPAERGFYHQMTKDATDASKQAGITFCQQAIDVVKGFSFGVNSPGDDNRWYGEYFVLAYDWCSDMMSSSDRAAIISNLNAAFAAFNAKDWGGPSQPENNYFWGCLRNSLEWGIASWGENPSAQSFLDEALNRRWRDAFVPFAAARGLGGVAEEGSHYGAYENGYGVVPFVTAKSLGRDVLGESNYFKEAVFFMIYATTPAMTTRRDGTQLWDQFGYGEDETWNESPGIAGDMGSLMTGATIEWDGTPVASYARKWLANTSIGGDFFVAPTATSGSASDFSALPLDYYAPGTGYFYIRNKWGTDATSIVLQLGNLDDHTRTGNGHGHLDAGTFQIWRKGRWVMRETVGYEETIKDYKGTGTTTLGETVAHNGILFGGLGEPDGSAYRVGPAHVVRLESRTNYAYAAVDLSDAYALNDQTRGPNPYVSKITREFLFVRPLEALVVFDRLEATSASAAKTFLAHFEKAPAVDGDSLLGIDGDQAARVTTLVPASPNYRVIDEHNGNNYDVEQWRLEVDSSGAAQGYFVNVIQARDQTGTNFTSSVSDNGTSYTVTVSHASKGKAVVTFNKGMTTTGGTFGYVADFAATPSAAALMTGVQGIHVGSDGPVWDL
jgi:hypothetical protein